jgi:GNAT superfamily N-acetyltransferase
MKTQTAKEIIRKLDGGLILRRATPQDAEALAHFNDTIHKDEDQETAEYVVIWTRDLMNGAHPTTSASDFTIVEDSQSGQIVSTMNLISQTWSYGGIEFGVGRPELVGTHPDYRNRGLIRAQFEVIHEWSAQRGHMLQAITGIPWYYRMFGYEMALALEGGRAGAKFQAPKLKEGEDKPYLVRPAVESDLPFITTVYQASRSRHLVNCPRDEALWRYELDGRTTGCADELQLCLITTPDGEPVGFLAHDGHLTRPTMRARAYELKEGVSWLAVTPSVVRHLVSAGEAYAEKDEKLDMTGYAFVLGTEHPVYEVFAHGLPRKWTPYAWYLRVPDLPAFLHLIKPVLEERLTKSPLVGHTGELTISFFQDGLKLAFEKGLITEIEPWQPTPKKWGMVLFPDLTFLQVLFGYRSFKEVEAAYPDCYITKEQLGTRPLVNALFPKQHSNVLALH